MHKHGTLALETLYDEGIKVVLGQRVDFAGLFQCFNSDDQLILHFCGGLLGRISLNIRAFNVIFIEGSCVPDVARVTGVERLNFSVLISSICQS
jgi:hypothetical protein